MMRIHIYCKTMDKGLTLLEKIKQEVSASDILCLKQTKFDATMELKSGTIYKVIRVSEACRGYKCHYAYIDEELTKALVDRVLFSTIIFLTSGAKRYEFF